MYRINGNLAVARSVGDLTERPYVTGNVMICIIVVLPWLFVFVISCYRLCYTCTRTHTHTYTLFAV